MSKESLLSALKPTLVDVEVEGFGTVTVKQLTVRESDALRATLKDDDKSSEFGLRLLGASIVDETGARMFTDAEVDQLGESSGPKVEALVTRVLEINGYKQVAAKNA